MKTKFQNSSMLEPEFVATTPQKRGLQTQLNQSAVDGDLLNPKSEMYKTQLEGGTPGQRDLHSGFRANKRQLQMNQTGTNSQSGAISSAKKPRMKGPGFLSVRRQSGATGNYVPYQDVRPTTVGRRSSLSRSQANGQPPNAYHLNHSLLYGYQNKCPDKTNVRNNKKAFAKNLHGEFIPPQMYNRCSTPTNGSIEIMGRHEYGDLHYFPRTRVRFFPATMQPNRYFFPEDKSPTKFSAHKHNNFGPDYRRSSTMEQNGSVRRAESLDRPQTNSNGRPGDYEE